MELLDLPTELFEKILCCVIQERGVKRGLRLTLVNKFFKRAFWQTVYSFRLLETTYKLPGRFRSRFYPNSVMQAYLEYRVMHEPTSGNPMLNCIRQVADKFFTERAPHGSTAHETHLRQLLWLWRSTSGLRHVLERQDPITTEEYENIVFANALRTNSLPMVLQCMAKNDRRLQHQWLRCSKSPIFNTFSDLAAANGDETLLKYILSSCTAIDERDLRTKLFVAAATAGRPIGIVRFLYDYKRTEMPWRFGQRPDNLNGEAYALYECLATSNLEVLTFIEELVTIYPALPRFNLDVTSRLRRYAAAGLLEMSAHVLQQGADIRGPPSMHTPVYNNDPIVEASENNRDIAIIDLLLEHGADPIVTIPAAASRGHKTLVQQLLARGIAPVQALSKAAAGPFLDIVCVLLDAGVDPNESIGAESPLASAISTEHTKMFVHLLNRGADLHSMGTAEECVRRARKDGLESMLRLLEQHGVDVDSVPDVRVDEEAGDG